MYHDARWGQRSPEIAFGWDVVGWFIGFALPLGFGVISLKEFRLAKICFGVSAVVLVLKVCYWGVQTNEPLQMRSLILVMSFSLIGVALVESIRWISKKQAVELARPSAPPVPVLAPLREREEHRRSATDTADRGHRSKALIDLHLRFVHPKQPALIIANQTDSIIRDIKWTVVLWNASRPEQLDPLHIP